MDYGKIKNIRYYVYDTIDEFHVDHPGKVPLKNWRDGKERDWVWSDDDRIVQLLKVSHSINHPHDRKNYKQANGWLRTVVGTFLNKPNTFMDTDFSDHPNRYTFSKKIKHPSKRVRERTKCTPKEHEFSINVAVGMGAVGAYMEAFKEEDTSKAQKKAAVLLKQERIMKEVEKGVMDIAKELGIDHEYILSNLKSLAETSVDPNISLQSLKELGKAIGTLGGGVKKVETGVLGLFQGFTPEQLETASRKELLPASIEGE